MPRHAQIIMAYQHDLSPEQTPDTAAPDLLLLNANVLTLEPQPPHAEAVAIRGQTIMAVGHHKDVAFHAGPGTRTIDCQGLTLLPGFVDAHCHLLATAASMRGLRCGPEAVSSITDLQRAVRSRAAGTPLGRWIRGFGYDDLELKERRHPTRWDLDSAAPEHPVRLDHRSGHATVLNSQGLLLAGINQDTPDPIDGVIARDEATGDPTGLLLEMAGYLRKGLGGDRSEADLEESVTRLNRRLLSYGITSVQDAGPNNGPDRWHTFQKLRASGHLAPRVTMMAGAGHLGQFLAEGGRWGDGDQWLRLGHVKVMLTLTTGVLQPDADSLRELVARARGAGFPVAIHAVEQEAVAAASQALFEVTTGSRSSDPPRRLFRDGGLVGPPRDRIEHCSECPPELMAKVRRSGAMVVTQPGFVFGRGDSYRERVDASLRNWLYPVGSLARSGVSVAFGSDSPVIDLNPWPGIFSAVTRATTSGAGLDGSGEGGPAHSQKVPVEAALRMFTLGGANAEGSGAVKGSIRRGKLADLVLVDKNPEGIDPWDLKDVRPMLTILGGQVVWEAGRG